LLAIAILGTFVHVHAATYKAVTKYPFCGTEGWNYITVDSAARRLIFHTARS
jgi:hypothetical protein